MSDCTIKNERSVLLFQLFNQVYIPPDSTTHIKEAKAYEAYRRNFFRKADFFNILHFIYPPHSKENIIS